MNADPTILTADDADGIRVLTLNRPHRLNAFDEQMRGELTDAIHAAWQSPELRVLIITGAGGAFCAGEDVTGMSELADMGTRMFRSIAHRVHDVFDALEAMEVPVVAAIDGVAAGGGLELALSCDFRILGQEARLIMPEVRVGLIPGSGGCSRLVKHVGLGRAKELVMLGRRLSPAEAVEWGLALEVVPAGQALDAALSLARRLTASAPLAIGMAKHILNTSANVDTETGRRLERLGQSILKTSADHKEGASAFLEKRTPVWTGR